MLLLPVTGAEILLSSALRAFPPPLSLFSEQFSSEYIKAPKTFQAKQFRFLVRKTGGGKACAELIAGFPSRI
jgi:hypothetical protein